MPHSSPLVVLIVEDDWAVRDVLGQQLRSAGWEVVETSTGEGALAALRTGRRVDVLITDIQLAGYLTGWDVAEAFRATISDLPIIYASSNPMEKSRRVPGSLFFGKPYEPAEILAASRKLVQTGRQRVAEGGTAGRGKRYT